MAEDPNAEVDWGNEEEIDNDDNDHDEISEEDDMDDSGEGSEEEEEDSDEEMESEEEEEDDDNDSSEGDDDSGEEDSNSDVIDDEIVEKFIRTFHTGDYNVELDNALCYDRGVTLPVRPTQASYIKPDNWRERNRIGLKKIQVHLQSCIESVLHGTSFSFNLALKHNGQQDQLVDNEEPIVWHEPILDEYWDQLEAKIDQINQQYYAITVIHAIEIWNVETKKQQLGALVAICRSRSVNNSFSFVKFDNANLCGEGIIFLSKLIDVSDQMIMLYLCRNRDLALCLSRSLKSHHRINYLDLAHCDLGSSPEILLVILQSDVEHIYLDNNNIDSLGGGQNCRVS